MFQPNLSPRVTCGLFLPLMNTLHRHGPVDLALTRLLSCEWTLLPWKYKAIPAPLGGAPESSIEISSKFVHEVSTQKQGWPDQCIPVWGEKQNKYGGQRGGNLLHPFLASCSTRVHNVSVSSASPAGTLGPQPLYPSTGGPRKYICTVL